MKHKHVLWILLIAVLVMGAKCESPLKTKSSSSSSSIFSFKQGSSSPIKTDYHTGRKGVVIDFIEGAPPNEIYEGDSFKVSVELNNQGTHKITEGAIYLINYDNEIEIRGENEKLFRLDEKGPNNPTGGHEVIEFELWTRQAPVLKKTKLAVEACYNYKTEAALNICIDPNYRKHLKLLDKGCEMKEVTSSGQGAPVVVTSVKTQIVETNRGENELRLYISIDDKGDGIVRDFDLGCGGEPLIKIDKIKFSEYSTEDETIKCKTKDDRDHGRHVKLREKKEENVITCNAKLTGINAAYTTPLVIELSYGYSSTENKEVKVKVFED